MFDKTVSVCSIVRENGREMNNTSRPDLTKKWEQFKWTKSFGLSSGLWSDQ